MTTAMRHGRPPPVLSTLLLLAGLALATPPLAAHEFTGGDLELLHPSAPPTPPGVTSAAGYLIVVNAGDEDDRLLGGRAPFATDIELHRTTVENDVARMRRLDDGLVIPAGTTVRLDPGRTHLMFTGLAEALPEGERRPATLVFERAGEIGVEFAIERPDTGDASTHAMDHGAMDHGTMDHGTMPDDATDRGDMEHGDMPDGTMPDDAVSDGGMNPGGTLDVR